MTADTARDILIFDDGCPLCTFQSRMLTWTDWFNRLALLPLSSERVAVVAPGVGREDLHEAIHCVTPRGRIHRGARALRHVGMKIPLMMPLALFLWIPGVILVAERVYQFVSRNRLVLSRMFGCGEACAVLPAKKREQDTPPGP